MKLRYRIGLLCCVISLPFVSSLTPASAHAVGACAPVDFSLVGKNGTTLKSVQQQVTSCAEFLMRTTFKSSPDLQCIQFVRVLMTRITPERVDPIVVGPVVIPWNWRDAGRRFTWLSANVSGFNLGSRRSVLQTAKLPYVMWWTEPANGLGHVAVYIGNGKFLDNHYFRENSRRAWDLNKDNWPSRRRGDAVVGYSLNWFD